MGETELTWTNRAAMPLILFTLFLTHLVWGETQAGEEDEDKGKTALRVALTRHQPAGPWSLLSPAELGSHGLVLSQISPSPDRTGVDRRVWWPTEAGVGQVAWLLWISFPLETNTSDLTTCNELDLWGQLNPSPQVHRTPLSTFTG